jgi:hypothetical protein
MKLFITNSLPDYDFVQTTEILRVECKHEKHGFIRIVAIRNEDISNQKMRYGSGNQLAELLDFNRIESFVGRNKEHTVECDWHTWYGRHYWKEPELHSYFTADDERNIMAASLWCEKHPVTS